VPAPNPIAVAPAYHRHRPEQTALYAIVAKHYPRFVQEIERAGGYLPGFVRQEFEDYLKCGLLEHGFLRVKCDGCRHEHLVAFSCKRRGFCPSCGAQRMDGAFQCFVSCTLTLLVISQPDDGRL
jgi:ribosomal protein S27E